MSGRRLARRGFLKAGAAALGLCSFPLAYTLMRSSSDGEIPIRLHGANARLGHRIRSGDVPAPSQRIQKEVVILGAGVSGLAAARKLFKSDVQDFVVLEAEQNIGGNAQAGVTSFGRHPFGAHYLPVPSEDSSFLYEFLEEAGVIVAFKDGRPVYNDEHVCFELEERLYLNGRFQEGLVPRHGVPQKDQEETARFFDVMEGFKKRRGKDGKPAFTIPLDLSSQDAEFLSLDTLSMQQFMRANGFSSPYLQWYVDYCCRDDFGADSRIVSAWAAVHYFASRRAPEPYDGANLTWPEGNSFLVNKLAASFRDKIQAQMLVTRVSHEGGKVLVNAYDARADRSLCFEAGAVICALPYFVTKLIFADALPLLEPHYYPWLVANLSVASVPGARGAPLAWDNVSYYSRSLGYINAAHQELIGASKGRNLTYYRPLDDEYFGVSKRHRVLQKQPHEWRKFIMKDLEAVHPGLSKQVLEIDMWVWGHGMVCPTVGYLWHSGRRDFPRNFGSVYFAHSDRSGISIFEEAYHQGIAAAEALLTSDPLIIS